MRYNIFRSGILLGSFRNTFFRATFTPYSIYAFTGLLTTILFSLLLGCVLVQAGYAFYYFYYLASFGGPEPPFNPEPVSVVICAHNEANNLQTLLPALLTQDYPTFEVVLVDDRSTDNTTDVVQQWQDFYPCLRLIKVAATPIGFNPKKFGLFLGIKAARYEHLLFTDADCKPLTNKWIDGMSRGFGTGAGIVIGYSPYQKIYGFLNNLIRYETLLTAIQYLSFSIRGSAYMAVGRNIAYTKNCFYQNKGFASHIRTIGGDDDLFVRDAGAHSSTTIEINKDAQTVSIPKQTYREWFLQKRRHLSVGRQYRFADQLRIGSFMMSNVFFYLISFVLLLLQQNLELVGILFVVRCLVLYIGYVRIARRLEQELSVWSLPVLDAAYFLHYLFLGVSVLMFKKVRWK
jgi:glycosyltransferase involved in cell wall biosynthesis